VVGWEMDLADWVISMVAVGLSAATIKRRQHSLAALAYRLAVLEGVFAPAGATRPMVERWLATLTAPRTRRAYYSDARLFFAWRVQRYGVSSPMEGIPRPRNPKSLPRPVPLDALRVAVGAAEDRLGTWMLCGALAGLRVGEIARLHSDDWEDATVVVRNGKGAKDRAVPCHPALADRLGRLGWGWVAPGPHGHLSPGWVSLRITRQLHACGIDSTAHALRHTFGTEAARASGGDVPAIAALMGHSSIQTTMSYVALAAERQREVVASLAWAS
jgi:integrase